MLYILSDPHFGHINILKYEPNRVHKLGATIDEHDKNLLARINARVKENDTLVIAGDFCLNSDIKKYREQIICKNVVLVMGNHDKVSPIQYYNCGFSLVCYELVLKIAGEMVRVRHHPYKKPWYKTFFFWQYKEKDSLKRPKDRGHFLIHGHIHSGGHNEGAWKVFKRQINIGVDVRDYYPVSLKELESIIQKEKSKVS
jgi:calcineurin-like phosphoesterase family protein